MEHLQSLFERQQSMLRAIPTASERRNQLQGLWNAVLAHEGALIEALEADLGKPREEVHLQEIYPLKAEIQLARRHLRGWMAPRPVDTGLAMLGTRSFVQANPKGHMLIISPWNFPVILTLRPLVSALAAGNRGDRQTFRTHPRNIQSPCGHRIPRTPRGARGSGPRRT